MSEVLKVHVEVDYEKIEGGIASLFKDDQLMLAIHQLLYKMCDPYVPMQSGVLAQSVEITKDYVRYTQPYAHYQYLGILYLAENGSAWAKYGEPKFPSSRMLVHSQEVHGKATRYWDKAMMAEQGETFIEQVRQLVIQRARQMYG